MTMMIKTNVFAGSHVLTIDVTRHVSGAYAARISRVMADQGPSMSRPRLTNVTVPVLVAEYRGDTPGAAIDRACDGARSALGISI